MSGSGAKPSAAHSESLVHVPGPLLSVARVALAIACWALVALAVVEAWQVVPRYVLDSPAAWTEAVALLLLKIALMLAAAVGVRQETHFRFALGAQAAGRGRAALDAFGRLVTAAIGGVLVIWGASLMIATWDVQGARRAAAHRPEFPALRRRRRADRALRRRAAAWWRERLRWRSPSCS